MTNTQFGQPIEILLVEDNPGDVRLTIEALKDSRVLNHLSVVKDGVEAIAYLRCEGGFAEAARPDLILLDLNLPKKNGHEVLQEIKGDEAFGKIPVIILTTSKAEQDVLKSYALHANCYITKPVDLEQFIKVIKSIEDFWLTVVNLPKDAERADLSGVVREKTFYGYTYSHNPNHPSSLSRRQ